mmetsp:Transcript_12799/g.28142  ORF Transcript_12799/g.28142 Transcript_12799/m.28142 type:complete len:233 (-) Transcript_12799:91-789(-)|eukprot:CAMPEP_0168808770 /NCGR_PEP_ID=MMETSP0726-20121227/2742_1 /TAXON_ID=265536 /ORGANISM="Amphiprora sp., Strain CCMP467" /LENGTH=232 /DNA_ID=CAMNT_0008860735 /DNA_START=53 /DNA_END=751 /DNA_ORIENTATION=-
MGGGDTLHCCYREQISYALYTNFREPKLYRLAAEGKWDLIPARCASHPREADFRHKYAPNDTALHRLLRTVEMEPPASATEITNNHDDDDGDIEFSTLMGQVKVNAIQSILDASRGSTAVRDGYGKTPLHYACLNIHVSAGVETIRLLAQANPAAACTQDNEGRTPLHYLVARNEGELPIDLIQTALIGPCSIVLESKDLMQETPLMIVKRQRGEISNADSLMKILVPRQST